WVRRRAATALGSFGPLARTAVPALQALLADEYPHNREAAATSLGKIGRDAAAAAPKLKQMVVGDPHRHARHAALLALLALRLARADIAPTLVTALADENEFVRADAAKALGELGDPGDSGPAVVAGLTARLADPDVWVRGAAAGSLAQLGAIAGKSGATIDALKAMVLRDDETDRNRRLAIDAIGSACTSNPTAGHASLIELFRAKTITERLRQAALQHLRDAGPTALEPVLPELIEMLGSDSALDAADARDSLAAIGEPAIVPLINAIRHDKVAVRESAVRLLRESQLPEVLPRAAAMLVVAITDESPDVSIGAQLALSRLSSPAPSLMPAIAAAWARLAPTHGGRLILADLIGRMGAEAHAAHLKRIGDMLPGSSGVPAQQLLRVVIAQGDKAATVAPQVASLLSSKDVEVARMAVTVLLRLGKASAPVIGELAAALQSDASEDLRWRCAVVIGRTGDKERGLPPLARALADTAPAVRAAAIRGLAELGDERAIMLLGGRLSDRDESVRRAAVRGLAFFGEKAASAVEQLRALTKDANTSAELKQDALDALERITGKRE
ncbi:MAG: HEAT repeat domain-containing protein, partial [Planctomycetota bacterium]